MGSSLLSAPGIDWQAFNQTLGRLAIEVTESAVLGCFEPKPISSCYEDEVPRVRRKILEARNGRLVRFRDQVNRNALLIGCLEYADNKPEEHLIIGYGFRHGSTTKVESLHHIIGGTNTVRLPDIVAHTMWDFYGQHESNELLVFHNHPVQPAELFVGQLALGFP